MTEMQEQVQEEEKNAYERLRDNPEVVSPALRRQWLEADGTANMLAHHYQRLVQDDELTEEAKQKRAQTLFQEQGAQVAAKRQAARDALLQAAEWADNASIPFVAGQAMSPSDSSALIASQHEADRIRRTLERRSEKRPFGDDAGKADFLKAEYERGLKLGGIEGAAICRGCLRASDEMGAGDEWLPRKESHHNQLYKAFQLRQAAGGIDTNPPRPPKALRRKGQRRGGQPGSRGPAPLLLGNGDNPISKKRTKHWS